MSRSSLSFERGHRRRPAAEPPEVEDGEVPSAFSAALDHHMRRRGENARDLRRALEQAGTVIEPGTLTKWRRGERVPATPLCLAAVRLIEERYLLPRGSMEKRIRGSRLYTRPGLESLSTAERKRVGWHLPGDFDARPAAEREDIVAWIRGNILTAGTAFSHYQSSIVRTHFSFQFATRDSVRNLPSRPPPPARLAEEMAELVRFKTVTLAPAGSRRKGVWGTETVAQRTDHLGLLFGAMAAAPHGPARGLGVDAAHLSLALLILPRLWDWYLKWREARRGFFTRWEYDMLLLGGSLARAETGWLRQSPHFAERLVPIPSLVDASEIAAVRADWNAACDAVYKHVVERASEVIRIARVHRDPFEAILPVLEADSPLGEYRKIPDEVLSRRPAQERSPVEAAEVNRAFLMLRIGLHTGLRQRNLRELLVGARGDAPRSERTLKDARRGELRWNTRIGGWEVFIPSVALKNGQSSYFAKHPLRLTLPDLGALYEVLEDYIGRDRRILLKDAPDPGTLFVKTVTRADARTSYSQTAFYCAWRLIITRYGIFNPYTGRGAIEGLLPHGPHSLRDVLATHVLKRTGSYEQAGYAIHDTAATVAAHYGRFLPEDKAALAAKVLNEAWAI